MRRLLRHFSSGIQPTDLDDADAIAIDAPSACVLQEALIILQEEANLVVMQISWPKTKLSWLSPHASPIKSTFSQTPHQHNNQDQHVSRPGCLHFALWP